jgi:hypothetical protein
MTPSTITPGSLRPDLSDEKKETGPVSAANAYFESSGSPSNEC